MVSVLLLNHAVGRFLSGFGPSFQRGRSQVPLSNEGQKARIHRPLSEMGREYFVGGEERGGNGYIMYIGDGVVQQARGSAYRYFFTGENENVPED